MLFLLVVVLDACDAHAHDDGRYTNEALHE